MTKKSFLSKNEILEQEYNSIREIVSNVLRSNNDSQFVDDLTQEVCLILLSQEDESIMTIYEQGYFKFYVARIVTNQALSVTSPFYKKYKYRIPDIDLTTEDYNPLMDKIWIDIHHFLTKKERDIVYLRYVYNLKPSEISSIKGISTRQVYKYLERIRGFLKKKYK